MDNSKQVEKRLYELESAMVDVWKAIGSQGGKIEDIETNQSLEDDSKQTGFINIWAKINDLESSIKNTDSRLTIAIQEMDKTKERIDVLTKNIGDLVQQMDKQAMLDADYSQELDERISGVQDRIINRIVQGEREIKSSIDRVETQVNDVRHDADNIERNLGSRIDSLEHQNAYGY